MDRTHIDKVIRQGIEELRLLELTYLDKTRIVEPHDYGVRKNIVTLLAYQIGGTSSRPLPNWRWLEIDGISAIRLLDRTFPGGRGVPGQKHNVWDELFTRVKPASPK